MKKWGCFILVSTILASCGNETIDKVENTNGKVDALIGPPAGWYTINGLTHSTVVDAQENTVGGLFPEDKLVVTAAVNNTGDVKLKTASVKMDKDAKAVDWNDNNESYDKISEISIWGKHRAYINLSGNLFYKKVGDVYAVHLGNGKKGRPVIHSGNPDRLDVFSKNNKDQLVVVSLVDNGKKWIKEKNLGGILASNPAVASLGSNNLDVLIRGTDDQLWNRWWNGQTWSQWLSLGGVLKSDPAVAVRNGKLDVVAYSDDGQLWRKTFDGRRWLKWKRMGFGPIGPDISNKLNVIASGDSSLIVLVSGKYGTIHYKKFSVK